MVNEGGGNLTGVLLEVNVFSVKNGNAFMRSVGERNSENPASC